MGRFLKVKRKGQLNFINVIFVGVAFLFLMVILPVAQAAIDTMYPTADTFTGATIRLFPSMMILALISVFFYYVFPRRLE